MTHTALEQHWLVSHCFERTTEATRHHNTPLHSCLFAGSDQAVQHVQPLAIIARPSHRTSLKCVSADPQAGLGSQYPQQPSRAAHSQSLNTHWKPCTAPSVQSMHRQPSSPASFSSTAGSRLAGRSFRAPSPDRKLQLAVQSLMMKTLGMQVCSAALRY